MKYGAFLLLATIMFAGSASATVYRCEHGGTVNYSDQPCPGGRPVTVDAPASDSKAARLQAENDKKTLQNLEKERQRQEAQEARERRQAQKQIAAREKKCGTLERRKRWAAEDAASAVGKSAEKAKRKARRATEAYEAECRS
jgi:hypothetical protein